MSHRRIPALIVFIAIAALLVGCGNTPGSAARPGHQRPTATGHTTTSRGAAKGSAVGSSGASSVASGGGGLTTQTPQIMGPHAVVNGCDPTIVNPPGPFGMCLDGLPHFSCCSGAATSWSGVVAGAPIDIKGAVPIDPKTRRPQSSAVLLLGPGGWHKAIPVGARGAFRELVVFPTAGQYQIGVRYLGSPADLEPFLVAWRWDVLQGTTVADVFPSDWNYFPQGDVLLMEEIGRPATFTIKIEDAEGHPEPGATLNVGSWLPLGQASSSGGQVANAQGVLTITLPSTDGIESVGQIEPGLLLMSYADIRPYGDTLLGFPTFARTSALPTSAPFTLVQDDVRTYDLEDFLARADDYNSFDGPGLPPGYAAPASSKALSLGNALGGTIARILLTTGEVQRAVVSGAYQPTVTWVSIGKVRPIMRGDQTYLTMQDLITVGSALGWAMPDGHGGMFFTFPWVP